MVAAESRNTQWCVLDLETTGLYPGGHDRIIEIGVVILEADGSFVREWHSLVDPQRDLGPTRLHGITADLASEAPLFSQLSGELIALLSGRRIASHNASFDRRFLLAEFDRANATPAGPLEILCTLHIASELGMGRSLESCCSTLEIENTAPHMAIGDARAAAEFLRYLLEREGRGHTSLAGRRLPKVFPAQAGTTRSRFALPRAEAAARATPESYLSRLIHRLPTPDLSEPVPKEVIVEYSALLDQVLEDRIVTDDELSDLTALASDLDLGAEQIRKINESYFRGLVAIARADGVVTDAEQRDLDRAGELLDIEAATLKQALTGARLTEQEVFPGDGREFEGLSVCFTGTSCCEVGGKRLTRTFASELATSAGLRVEKRVTEGLDLLVVADPHTQSGKAKTARRFGTRIVAERSFWPRVGVSID